MQALANARALTTRNSKTRVRGSTVRHITDIERDCAEIRSNLVLRVREQTAEALVMHKNYEEVRNPFDEVKQLCSQPRRKKKTRSSSKKRALELQLAMVDAATTSPPAVEEKPVLSNAPSAPMTVEQPSLSFTSKDVKTGLSFKALFRRYSAQFSHCNPALDELVSPSAQTVRSTGSFVGEQYRSVETC